MCGSSLMYPPYSYEPQHCMGCRCFAYTTTTDTKTGLSFVTTYQPRHRKPGPAQ